MGGSTATDVDNLTLSLRVVAGGRANAPITLRRSGEVAPTASWPVAPAVRCRQLSLSGRVGASRRAQHQHLDLQRRRLSANGSSNLNLTGIDNTAGGSQAYHQRELCGGAAPIKSSTRHRSAVAAATIHDQHAVTTSTWIARRAHGFQHRVLASYSACPIPYIQLRRMR
ncbi:MAG: hypothetical protein H7A20_01730 [Rhodanobacteraceae bacterium]|nr:hypothetical protein [Rhodanobacteraceae bacterium]